MKTAFKIIFAVLLVLGAAALATYFISTHSIPVIESKGMIGIKQRNLIITASLLMLIVVIPVFIFTAAFCWKYRASNGKAKHAPDWEHNYIAEMCWWGVPLVIIVVLAVITWKSSHELNPFRPIENGRKPIEIQVVALDWKWLFIYPEQGVAAVNYVQFPEETPLNFVITADAPMNSFWIPQLGGQIYAMPAMRTQLHLIANETGVFRGQSANISGKGFAGMVFTAKASTQEEFDEWVKLAKQSQNHLTYDEYNRLVEPSEYDPVRLYDLKQRDLFELILRKYEPR